MAQNGEKKRWHETGKKKTSGTKWGKQNTAQNGVSKHNNRICLWPRTVQYRVIWDHPHRIT